MLFLRGHDGELTDQLDLENGKQAAAGEILLRFRAAISCSEQQRRADAPMGCVMALYYGLENIVAVCYGLRGTVYYPSLALFYCCRNKKSASSFKHSAFT